MSSLKCPECSFTNFANAEKCKKCNADLKQARAERRTPRPVKPLPENTHLCLSCENLVVPSLKFKSSVYIEGAFVLIGVVLFCAVNWILGAIFFAVGVALALFHGSQGQQKLCPACQQTNLVPASSPVAQKVLERA